MDKFTTLQNRLLVAMPSLDDPHFSQAVIYIYEHNTQGAIGITINKPMDLTLEGLLKQLALPISKDLYKESSPILLGGPVAQKYGFVIHLDTQTQSNIVLTMSRKILKSIGEGRGPEQAIVSLGCAGWESGELEQELMENRWIVAPANPEIFFGVPFEKRWKAAAFLAGVDFTFLSPNIGHV